MTDLRIETPLPAVRLLVLSRPSRRNALTRELISALVARLAEAEAEGMRAVVIAAEGPAFCAGADFADLEGNAADEGFDSAMSELTRKLTGSPLISFAAIRGACVGAGLDLAMACDFRVAAPDASFALPAVKMGILYNPERLADLLKLVGPAAASRLLLLADRLDCDEAAAAGIVTHRAAQQDNADPLATSLALAARAAALPPLAQAASKAFLAAARQTGFDPATWQERRRALLASEERMTALQTARKPRS